jgi:hypothetical protein
MCVDYSEAYWKDLQDFKKRTANSGYMHEEILVVMYRLEVGGKYRALPANDCMGKVFTGE